MKLDCIIIEDEPLALDRTCEFARRLPYLSVVATFENAVEALGFLRTKSVDLIFLDINLGDFSGIDLLETGAVAAPVILTTAYQEYAIRAFDLNVTDYLLKPFTFERFVQAVERVRDRKPPKPTSAPRSFIFVKTDGRLEKINLRDILFIEGMGDYRRIHTVHKKLMTQQTFAEFENQIPPSKLCRVHKSFMVAPDKIDSIDKDRILIRGVEIPISDTYRKRFFAVIRV